MALQQHTFGQTSHSTGPHSKRWKGADPSTDAVADSASGLLCVTKADFAVAEARVRPSALRELAVEVPRVRWDDVGGLGDVKQR